MSEDLVTRLQATPGGRDVDWTTTATAHPALSEAYIALASVPARSANLEPKVRDLVMLAINAQVTHMDDGAVRTLIEDALGHGATPAEISETLELASVIGIHSLTLGIPILQETLTATGHDEPLPPIDERRAAIKAEFVEKRGYWSDMWETVLGLAPDYLAAYTSYSTLPWTAGVLPPKVKEFIYVIVTANTTHLFDPGVRVHMANAINYGATAAELLELLELASLIGFKTVTLGSQVLQEVLEERA